MAAARRVKLTKAAIQTLPQVRPGEQGYIVRDVAVRNFFLLVGARTKTFMVQRDIRDADGARRSIRRSLGHWRDDGTGVTCEAARQAAHKALAEIHDTKGQPSPRGGMTLREAYELFKVSNAKRGPRKGQPRAPATVQHNDQIITAGYLASWLDRPLRSIGREEAYQRHQQLTGEIAAGNYAGDRKGGARGDGRQQADDVFRLFRSIWNRAMRQDESLAVCPTVNLEWHGVKRERTAIPTERLKAWHDGVLKIANPVRRDFLLFTLFSGMRRTAAAEMLWADVDFKRKLLRVPNPKGGTALAFDLPLSDFLLELLQRRRAENPQLAELQVIPADASEWVWPAYGASRHIAEPREEIAGVPFTIHDLRRTFVSQAEALNIPLHVVGALVNHRQPRGSMTAEYARHEVERLREPMQQITDRLLTLCTGPGPANVLPLRRKVKGVDHGMV